MKGKLIWEFEWDVCCILDGCRVDTFKEFYSDASSYTSVASTSQNWIPRTFKNSPENVGYISANPFSNKADPYVKYLHQEPVTDVGEIETVHPYTLTNISHSVWRDKNLDRMVIHYMQPHVPFRSRPEWFTKYNNTDTWGSGCWNMIKNNKVSEEEWMTAYKDNLKWVLESGVGVLSHCIDSKIMITADHGNAKGEQGVYAHPFDCDVPSVREVPIYIFNGSKKLDLDTHTEKNTLSDTEREKQLKALGYK